jgi:hypothetical protein
MTVSEVVETTMNRVAELSRIQPDERRASTRMEACEFERLLERAVEILSIRTQNAAASKNRS